MATALMINAPECAICCEMFKAPTIFPCGHTFCLYCIKGYIGDKTQKFPCPICGQDINIPQGGAQMFTTNFIAQTPAYATDSIGTTSPQISLVTGTTSPQTSQVTGTTSPQTSLVTGTTSPQTSQVNNCPNHSKKEIDYFCQTCNLGLCLRCIYRDHKDHKTLDLESDSIREMVVEELSKSEKIIKNKIKDLEKIHASLEETSEKLKTFCEEACSKVSEKTEKMICELKENCEKTKKEIRNHFDKNKSQLTKSKQKVLTQIKNIKTDLDTNSLSIPEPSLTLVNSLTKLKDLLKLCDNMIIDVPQVTYVEWKESNGKVCDILGSTETKTLYQSSEGNVFKFNYKDIKSDGEWYYGKEEYKSNNRVWSCELIRYRESRKKGYYFQIYIQSQEEDDKDIDYRDVKHNVTLINKDNDKNVTRGTLTNRFTPGFKFCSLQTPWDKLTDQSEGFIDKEGQFLVRLDILEVLDIKYK